MREESRTRPEELPYIFQDNQKLSYTFELCPVSNGMKKVCIYRVAESFGNILAEWGKLGYTDNLMRSEISYLEKICTPRMEVHYLQAESRKLLINIELKANEMALIQIQ